MASPALVGIDIGSSAVKACIWRVDGYYRAAFRPARAARPEDWAGSAGAEGPGRAAAGAGGEQDPDHIWAAVIECLDEVMSGQDPGAVRGVGLSGHGPSLIAVDGYGRALSNIITWMDVRPVQAWEAEASGPLGLSGPSFEATAAWLYRRLLEDGHDVTGEVVRVLQPKDYIGLMLTGNAWMDRPAASCMLSWPMDGHPAQGLLPPAVDPWQSGGTVSAVAGGETGLLEGTPVAAGGIDAFMEALGAGIVGPGIACDSTGTSTCVAVVAADGPNPLAVQHVAPGRRILVMPVSSSGGALAWAMSTAMPDVFRRQTDWTQPVCEAVGRSAPGAGRLTFIPHMTGRRSPTSNPLARGALVGLSPVHTASDIIRSVLEGCAYSMRECVHACLDGAPVSELRAVGSGARHDVWLQIKADVLQVPIVRMKVCEGALAGAVILAGVAAGVFRDVDEGVEAVVQPDARFEPSRDPLLCAAYEDAFDRFRRVEEALERIWV